MFDFILSMNIWLQVVLWIVLFVTGLALFSIFEKREHKIFKFISIMFALLVLALVLVPIVFLVSEGYNQLKTLISSHFSEFISLIALVVSILSVVLTNLIFDKKVLIMKGLNSNGGAYIEIVNTSNKDIEIKKFFVDKIELIANAEKSNIKTQPIVIDGITYCMFNRDGNVKVCKGSDVKIQYSRNSTKTDLRVLRFSIEVEYKTLGLKRKKTIETDLSPFV